MRLRSVRGLLSIERAIIYREAWGLGSMRGECGAGIYSKDCDLWGGCEADIYDGWMWGWNL